MMNFNNNGVLVGKIVKVTVTNKLIKVALNTSTDPQKTKFNFVLVSLKYKNLLEQVKPTQTVMFNCHLTSGFFKQNGQRVYQVYTLADNVTVV